MPTPDTPLFVKTHDFIVWLIRHTQRFAKNLRHSYTNRLESAAFEARPTEQPTGPQAGRRLVFCHLKNRGSWGRGRESVVEPTTEPKLGLAQRNKSRAGTSL